LGGLMRDEAGWESWLSRFQGYHDSWERRGFIQMFRFLLLREKVRTRLLSLPNGERRLTNILHLSEVLHQEATEQKLGMVGLIKWLARQRDERSPRLEEHQLRLESDAHAVKLVTIHKSKGLEYPIVFCPFNWDGSRIGTRDTFTFHGRDGKLTLVLDAKENPNRALGEKELLAENLRLLYVSLTRARNRCYLVWGRFNEAETSSLAYILHSKDGDPDNIVSATGEHFGGLPDQEVRLDLVAISRNSGGAILFTDIPMAPGKKHSPPEERRDELTCRTFSAVLEKERHFASFSYLVARQAREAGLIEHSSVDLPDHDQNLGGEEGMPEEELSGIFAFPKGARPGVLLHDIFEHLDFTRSKNESVKPLVGDKLREYGFEAKWEDTVCDMVRKVLTVPLLQGRGNFTLSAITLRDRLSELEFYYPLKSITPAGLRQIFARHGGGDIPAEFPDRIEELNFLPAKGFMRGFIDLVFQFEGRFYIVDWKSNLLGSRIESYGREALAAEMEEKFYILQSHLYTVAVNQYLKVRVPGYDYEKHFGGVIYLFLRGIAPEHGSEFGVYRSVPNKELIEGLCENLIGRE
jgi:exodeoxyribonuclease V beta subunit